MQMNMSVAILIVVHACSSLIPRTMWMIAFKVTAGQLMREYQLIN